MWIENYKTGGVMIKVTLYKGVNVRSGETQLRFRLRDGKDVDLALESGKMVSGIRENGIGKGLDDFRPGWECAEGGVGV